MLKSFIIAVVLVLTALQGYGQIDSLNYGPEPKGGISRVALPFYKINFSREQKELLKGKDIELIFSVNEQGVATLEDINGVTDQVILDSLQQASVNVPAFYPRTVNGVKESSLYFLQFQLPAYAPGQVKSLQPTILFYKEHPYEDYEYIHKSGIRLDMLIGAAANAFLGKPGEYLHPGGGMKLDMMFTGKKGIGGGMIMGIYGNQLKQDYPISSGREQNSDPPTMLLGLALNKFLLIKERSELNAQLELAYAVHNVTPKLGDTDTDWVQFVGFSPGLVVNYLIKIGKDKTAFSYAGPSVSNNYLNIHGALRPVFYNHNAATGVMVEAGVSYRLTYHLVDEYRLK